MKVTWFGSITDCEMDLTAAIAKHPEISLTFYALTDPADKNHEYHRSMVTESTNIIVNEINTTQLEEVCKFVAEQENDLIIIRHPVWIPNDGAAKEISDILSPKQKLIVWTWEWVPNYAMAQMPPLNPWPRIAVTNSQDMHRAKMSYPNKQILYLPFGVVNRTPEELAPMEQYSTDLMCDAQPHYECKEYNGIKRASVDQMIKPAFEFPEYKLALWGSRYGETTPCDWGSTPEFVPYHRGHFKTMEYPHVYASAKLYLGVTWNYGTGGYSIRLARALSIGIPTIWQDTVGRETDIPENVLQWSLNYDHTKEAIKYLMEHEDKRLELGRKGKEFALRNWEWAVLLNKLVQEVT